MDLQSTVTLYQPPPGQTSIDPPVEIYGTPLKSVKNFTYLGSTVASDNTIDVEVNNHIQAASGAFGGRWKRVWSQHGISVFTKCKVYKAIVLPTLLYSAETYTLYRRHFRKLSKVHLRHLRQILRISWKDNIQNVEVLRWANMSSIEATLMASQLRWTGHIIHMNDSRLPKAVFYGELAKGKCLHGGQRLRYKDVVKRHLKATYITVDHWETLAQDQQQWRQAIHRGKTHTEENISQKYQHGQISAMAFLMLLPLSSSVSTVGETLNLKLDYSLTNEQSTSQTKPYTDVIIGYNEQQRERDISTDP